MKRLLFYRGTLGVAVTIWCTCAAADTFYVAPGGENGNLGTSSGTAWGTLQFAADQVGAGDTVHVLSGTYTGFDLRTSGTASDPISFLAEPGVVIDEVNPVTNRDGINLEGASYVVIDGFTLDSPSSSTRAGIRSVGDGYGYNQGEFSRCVTIRNNTATGWGKWGIFTGFVHDLLIEGNSTSGAIDEHGIYVSNSGDRPVIRGNLVFGNHGNGIHMNGDIYSGDPDESPDVDGIISEPLVEGNIIFGNGEGGGSAINGDGVVDARIVNNLLYNNHSSGISLYQIDGAGPSTGGEIVNNTIINASDARWVINLRNGATGTTVFNNILFNLNGSSYRGAICAFEGSEAGLVSDYNLVDPRFSLVDDTRAIDLAAWFASTGNDENSAALTLAQMEALFTDYVTEDFTLAEMSDARDFGVASLLNDGTVAAPGFDLLGITRPSGEGFDAGAYEFVSDPPVVDSDLNGDGTVGSADLDIVRGNWGQAVETGCLVCGDPSGDGVVGSADLDVVRANWGAGVAAVPEPGLLVFGFLIPGVLAWRRK